MKTENKILNAVMNVGLSSQMQLDYKISNLDIISNVISIVLRTVAFIVNINAAREYYIRDQNTYFLWTLFSLLVPGIVTVIISLQM